MFELGLGPLALAAVGASSPGDQQLISAILAEHGAESFAAAYYAAKGHAEVATYLAERTGPPRAKVA